MESRHCPYLALPNMVSELMLDSISFFQLYRGLAMSEPIGMNLSQRMESEPSRFYKSSFVHRLGPTKPYCPVRKVYHDHFARPIEAPHVGPAKPNARADLSHTVSPPVSEAIRAVRADWYGDWLFLRQKSARVIMVRLTTAASTLFHTSREMRH